MNGRRLSRLQRSILSVLFKSMGSDPACPLPGLSIYQQVLDEVSRFSSRWIETNQNPVTRKIYRHVCGSFRSSFSRSIWGLWGKDLIRARCAADCARDANEELGVQLREPLWRQRNRIQLIYLSPRGLKLISDINTKGEIHATD